MNRDAVSTIKGYFYQFDLTILELLKLPKGNSSITIEGTEDIDLNDISTTAVQCKYYEYSEYNHSVIAKPIRLMLKDYSDKYKAGKPSIKYKLYGYYKKGQHKLALPITVKDLKDKFLTYTIKGTKKEEHKILSLSDAKLKEFIDLLTIDINAEEFSKQLTSVFNEIKKEFNCSDFETKHLFYSNSIVKIKELSILKSKAKRTIKRREFIKSIDKKDILHREWFLQIRKQDKHLKAIKREYFTSLNISPFERFFLIEKRKIDTLSDLSEIVRLISKKYSKLSKKETTPFCPTVFIYGISNKDCKALKTSLFKNDYVILDGYPFKNSDFNTVQLSIKPNFYNNIKLKFVDTIKDLKKYKSTISNTIEVYQFYFKKPFYVETDKSFKHIQIQIDQVSTIKHIV